MGRRTLRHLVAVLLALASGLPLATPVAAQDPASTTTVPAGSPSDGIIPLPDSGAPPQEPGDRGGALQLALLAGLVLAIGGVVLVLVRQSRRARDGG